jgi:hypothetical protein
MRRACEFPDQCVFTTTRTDNKNLHPSGESISTLSTKEADFPHVAARFKKG